MKTIKLGRKISEKAFSKIFKKACVVNGCDWIVIPDPNQALQKIFRANPLLQKKGKYYEQKRPCDGIFHSPEKTIFIELKVENNQITPHQKKEREKINKIKDKSYRVVVRRKGKHYLDGRLIGDIQQLIHHLRS